MQKYQSNKYNSYMGIKAMFDENKVLFESNALAGKLVREYLDLMEEIIVVAGRSDTKTKKITKDKLQAKVAMAQTAIAMASAGSIYAQDVEDAALHSELSYSFTKIRYAKDADALRISTGIEINLRKHAADLNAYMVTQKDLDDLKKAIDAFQELYGLRIEVKNDAKTDKKILAKLFHKMDELLDKRIDLLMRRLGRDHPDAAAHYFQARKIDDI